MHVLLGHAERDDVLTRGLRDGQERRSRVQELQRQRLGHDRRDRALATELGDVVVAVDVVHERHARLLQPQRRQECDPVDDLQDDVGVAREPAPDRPRRAREDRRARPHVMQLQPRGRLRDLLGARVRPGDDGHAVPPLEPIGDLAEQVRAGPAALRVRPVAVGQEQDVPHCREDRSRLWPLHWPAYAARCATPARACRWRGSARDHPRHGARPGRRGRPVLRPVRLGTGARRRPRRPRARRRPPRPRRRRPPRPLRPPASPAPRPRRPLRVRSCRTPASTTG